MEFANALGKRIESIAPADLTVLQQYSWPGNIRELRNVVERAIILAQGSRLAIPLPVVSVPRVQTAGDSNSDRMTDVERDHIRKVLDKAGWRIRGTGGAAARLGMRPTTLETRMAKLGLTRLRC